MHITLTGNLGSGKSTICKILEEKYGKEIYSTGKVQRSIAEEMGMNVLEMNELMKKDHKYDHLIDDTTAKIARENPDKPIVFDSRLAWNFVETSFKVFLSVSLNIAAERVYSDKKRGEVEEYSSVEDTKANLKKRAEIENIRYKDIYGLDYFNFNNYNLILDSTFCTPECLASLLIKEAAEYEQKLAAGETPSLKILMSPKRLGMECAPFVFKDKLYPDGIVTLVQTENDFDIKEGREIAEDAARAGMPFVSAVLLNL